MRTSLRRFALAVAVIATAAIVTSPAWAAFPNQGKRILYARQPVSTSTPPTALLGTATSNLFSIRNNGEDRRRVTDSVKAFEYGGYHSPDGTRIVYWAQTPDGYQVWRANADGVAREALTSNPVSVNPNWSRNGNKIVYVKYSGPAASLQLGGPLAQEPHVGGGADLMIMNADGTGKHSILAGTVYSPGWSPTAPEIAYSGPSGPGLGLFLISPEGGEPQIVCCKAGGTALFADWSPDGRRLLFVYLPPAAGPGAGVQLLTVRRNSTDVVPVTNDSYNITIPRFSDDGERVIYAKDVGGGLLDLYSINSDGSGGKKRLTDTPALSEWLNYVIG